MNLRRNLSKYLALYSYVEAYRSNKLPEGYTRLSYIQGDGTAYIDLGLSLTQDDNIEIDFIAKYTTSAQIFGYRDGPSSNNILLFTGGGPNSIFLDFNNSNYATYRTSDTLTDDNEYKAILNKNVRQLLDSNGNVIAENTAVCSDTITTGNVYLFFANGLPSGNNKFTGSIKEVVISNKMDLIPCKDPNNNVGMYDIISGKFFGNSASSGAFIAGEEIKDDYLGFNTIKLKDAIHGKLNELTVYGKTKNKAVDGLDSLIANGGTELIPETYLDTVIAKGKCVQENRLTNGLPSEYQELYYIESDGAQYINTNYIPNNETKVECVVDRPIAPANGYVWYPFATENDSTNGQFTVFESTNGAGEKYAALTWGKVATSEVVTGATTSYSKSLFVLQNGVLTYDNNKTITSPQAGQTFNCIKPITLFKRLGTASNFVPVRIYSFKLYQGTALIMNLLPARRKADGELGMYDTISKTFLTNQDTGTFTASEDKLIDTTSSDYTILDYATFDGTQVVDTGVICNEESRIESKWMANSSSVLVYGTGADNPRITCYCVSSGNERFGNVTVDSTGITHNVLNTVTHDKNGFYYNGTNGKPYSNVGTFTCLNTLTIGNSNGSTGTAYFTGNFYYMRIYDNGVLVRSYIPVKRNSDNVVGFFDTVSGTFITQFEGNALVAGTVKTTWEPTPNFPVDIWCNNGKIDKSGNVIALPSDYTQLEYLESTGTQYIDTGIKGNQNTKVRIKTRYYTTTTAGGSGRIFGSRVAAADDAFAIGSASGTASTNSTVSFFFGNQNYLVTDKPIILDEWLDIVFDKTTHNINGVDYGEPYNDETFETPLNLKLFGFDNYGTTGVSYIDVAYCQLWDNNVLIRNLVPAKNSSGVIGMYDTVSGTFFTNAGTGDFVAGPTVDNRNVQEVITAPNGKNLFDKNDIQRIYGYFNATGGKWTWATNGNSVKIPCKPNTKYTARYDDTFSIVVLGFGSTYTDDEPSANNVSVLVTNSIRTPNPTKDTPVTITTGANDKWLIVAWPADELYPDQYEEVRQHLIVEEGETPTEYEIGKGFNTAKCENLLSVGTYQDTQSILDGTITRNVGVKVLDGTEDWVLGSGTSESSFYVYSDSAISGRKIGATGSLVSHFEVRTSSILGTIGKCFFGVSTQRINFTIAPALANSVPAFKQWLADQYAAGTPVIIVYPLATPVTETTSSANLKKKEVSVIGGSLSISDLEVTSTESEHTIPTPSQPLSLRCNNGDFIAGPAVVNIKGTQETVITVKETNLFDKDTVSYINAYVNANTGVLTQGSPGSDTQYCFIIPCKSNTTYKLDGMGANRSAWGSFTDNTIGTTATTYVRGNDTLTTGPNDHYLIGLAYTTSGTYDYRDTLDIREMDIMAYVENLLASSTYADTQNILTGLITHAVGIKVLDGTEDWTYSASWSDTTHKCYYVALLTDIKQQTASDNNCLCSHFKWYSRDDMYNDKTIIGGCISGYTPTNPESGKALTFRISSSIAESAADFKQWLANQYTTGTPVIVVYPLATPTTESVDAQPMRNGPAFIKDASMEGLTLTQTHSIHTIPTPAFPLDLVCNNGIIKGVSKNLFDPSPSNIICGYWIKNNNGQLEASAQNFYTDYFMPVKPDTSYVAFGRKKLNNTLSNYNRIAWYDSSKTWIRNSTYTQGTIGTDTSPSNAAYARFHCNVDGSVLSIDHVLEWSWMFYEGTEEESFVPYGIITEGNPEILNIKGKNLYDITKDTTGKYIGENGSIGDEPYSCYSDLIPVKEGESYTYSGVCNTGSVSAANNKRIHGYINGVWNQQIAVITINKNTPFYTTFTIPAGINGIRISHWTDDTHTQVEEGIRPTHYEDYKNESYIMPTLLSAGNFVDTQELQSGIYNGKIGVKVFDGSEEWSNISGYYNISKTDIGSNSTVMPSASINIICTHYETISGVSNRTSVNIGGSYVNFKDDNISTLSDWTQYLADQYAKGTPVIIVYPLANTSTKTEESKHIHIDAGTNTITRISDTDELEMEVRYKKLK